MTNKALIVTPDFPRTEKVAALEDAEAKSLGLKVEHHLAHGTLVRGDEKKFKKLEAQGYRVKVFPDTNILRVGSYRIDIESAPPVVPANLEVPKALEKTWRHYLVQLAGPPAEEWTRAIEDQGIDVVEPISAYGLFVVGTADEVKHLKKLPFVDWVGPFKPAYRIAPNLRELKGKIQYVNIGVYPETAIPEVRRGIEKAKGVVVNEWGREGSYNEKYRILIAELDAKRLADVACLPAVRWLEYQSPILTADDERSAQIVAENLNGAAPPNTAPVTGYQNAVTSAAGLGLSGAGVVVGICDSGVDTNNNATLHNDLRGRMTFFVDQTGGQTPVDGWWDPGWGRQGGHGTHVAGIAVGNAATGDTDPQGFRLGQGMAPAANFGVLNPVDTPGGAGTGPVADFTRLMVNNGANVMNNSWRQGGGGGYTAGAALVDKLVRDPNSNTATLDYLVLVFSAGNSGPNASTITPPKEAKNPIVVGSTLNHRPGEQHHVRCTSDDIQGLVGSSSRGPAADGRFLPTIVAPGCDIISSRTTINVANPATGAAQRPVAAYTDTGGTVHNEHTPMSGTSMAAPHVTGLCALLIEWWRNRTNGKNPSPALLKALLINGAEDLSGGPDGAGGNLTHIPNNSQGWGRVSLANIVLQAPASDRGPKIFTDQRHAFTSSGQQHMIRVSPVDTGRPMRITLVWTDAPGAANANPALVNDLDLEVSEELPSGATGNVYRGNVFANGFSTTGGAFDTINNIECVYIQNPSGIYKVRVLASNIAASARSDVLTPWQDFALVIDNAEVSSDVPVSVVPVIDRSGSMVFSGYENITRISSKQFLDLMSIDDKVGVVSFGSTGEVEYPTGAAPSIQTITGQPIRDAAKAEIDSMVFGGCTYMGEGIIKARDLLNPATGSRAMVLLSDGYDNKGCHPNDPSRLSAIQAVGQLPTSPPMPVYTCAMGPSSDQGLLELIANSTGGLYYYMPTIDDLFEIYNYIRGQITSTSIIANESASASSSRVGAFVDALATEATFTVAWADTKFKFVLRNPEESYDLSIRLRDPRGRLLHPSFSHVHRTVGEGYVAFKLTDPMPGLWFVEVATRRGAHVQYTVGGFVKSALRMAVTLLPQQIVAGKAMTIATQIFDGKQRIKWFRAAADVVSPSLSIAGLMSKYKKALGAIRPRQVHRDKLPLDIAKLVMLREKMLKDKADLFAPVITRVPLQNVTTSHLMSSGLRYLMETEDSVEAAVSGISIGSFANTTQQGSYNITVTTRGYSPFSNTRFVRKELVSVLVK